MSLRYPALLLLLPFAIAGQPSNESPEVAPAASSTPQRADFEVPAGTRVPLSMVNSISSKHASEGERVYLETVFPIVVAGKIVIPPGSYVEGTVTQVKRPGRVKGRGEIYVRFDSLILKNGVVREFRARIGGLDGRASETLNKDEGKIVGDSDRGGDLKTTAETTISGASVGAIAGGVAGHPGMGAGVGALAGAAVGLATVLLTRGPDAELAKGTTVEMVIDRPLKFSENEIPSESSERRAIGEGAGPRTTQQRNGSPSNGRRLPF